SEAVLRFLNYGHPLLYRPSATLHWELKPHQEIHIPGAARVILVNSLGFRGVDFDAEKKPGTSRIVVLGDSVTFGVCVDEDETFPFLLAEILRGRRTERRWDVVNAGVPGYGSEQEVGVLNEKGLALRPDVVVLAFCANDWTRPISATPAGRLEHHAW